MTIQHKLTIQLIRYEIAQIPVDKDLLDLVTDDVLSLVYDFSLVQDVVYIVGCALSKLGLLSGDIKTAFFNEQLASVYRCEQLMHELQSVSELFEREEIPFVALKGSVVREYYPKPEMRMSCDMDVLVHKQDITRAEKAITEKLGYIYCDKCSHDVSYETPTGAKLELHFTLLEGESQAEKLLSDVWQYANSCNNHIYKHELQNEFFVFYHIVHMSKHFKAGGCGLRPFLDIYVMMNKIKLDEDALFEMLKQAGLYKFGQYVFKVAKIWFDNDTGDKTTELLSEYIFGAGIYGSIENMVAVSQAKRGSKFKEIFQRIFMPYNILKISYPIIIKYPVLTPVFEVVRWFRIIFKDKAKKQINIIKHNLSMSEEKKNNVTKLFKELELM